MNNLNNPPPNWNIQPNARNNEDHGSKWNYALLVPMLGLAAFLWTRNRILQKNVDLRLDELTDVCPISNKFRIFPFFIKFGFALNWKPVLVFTMILSCLTGWIWSRESKKEIEKEKRNVYRKLSFVQKELESKYRDIIIENRRMVAHLELELEKERNRTLSYRNALISQSYKLVEERRILEQERTKVEQEKRILQHSGAAGALYKNCLEKEDQWQTKATILLKEFEEALMERQDMYCSLVLPRYHRLAMEKKMLAKATTDPIGLELELEAGLKDIFRYDTFCSNLLNTNKNQNGKLMWIYLRYWELSVEVRKFKKAEKIFLGKTA